MIDSSKNDSSTVMRPNPTARSVPISRALEATAAYIVLATANMAPIVRIMAIVRPTIFSAMPLIGLLREVRRLAHRVEPELLVVLDPIRQSLRRRSALLVRI